MRIKYTSFSKKNISRFRAKSTQTCQTYPEKSIKMNFHSYRDQLKSSLLQLLKKEKNFGYSFSCRCYRSRPNGSTVKLQKGDLLDQLPDQGRGQCCNNQDSNVLSLVCLSHAADLCFVRVVSASLLTSSWFMNKMTLPPSIHPSFGSPVAFDARLLTHSASRLANQPTSRSFMDSWLSMLNSLLIIKIVKYRGSCKGAYFILFFPPLPLLFSM